MVIKRRTARAVSVDGELPTPPRSLWRDRDFSVFWAAQTLSVVGDSFALVAVPLLVLHATGSVAQMGLLTGAAGVASVAAGVFAGVLVDRLDRRTLLIVCDLARMALYGVIPAVWAFGPQIWLLYVVLPLSEAVGMLFQVTYVTAVRNLVDVDHITEANGRLNATAAAAGVLGPLCAGLVAAQFGATAAIAINAASFAVSAVGVYFIRLRGQADAGPVQGAAQRKKPWQEFFAGARFLWGHPVLRSLTVMLSFFSFLTLGVNDVLIYHLKHDLGRSDGTIGTVLAAAAVGTITGSLLVARMRRRLGFGASWIGAHAICGLALANLGVADSVPVIAALAAVYLGSIAVAGTCSMSLRQQVTPDALLGRVTSAFWTIQFSLGPLGAVALTWLAGRYGTTSVGLVIGTCCLLIAAVALFTPISQPHPERSSRIA